MTGRLTRRSLVAGAAACLVSQVADRAGGLLGGASRRSASAPAGRRPDHQTRTIAERRAAQHDAVFSVATDEPIVALSFDDGPDPAYTPAVLDVLARWGAQATFFVVGVNAAAHPELVVRQLRAGCVIGNHTYDHARLELLDTAAVVQEIVGGSSAITAAGAPAPRLFRPPRGFTNRTVEQATVATGPIRTVFWDLCLEHFVHRPDPEDGIESLLAGVRRGSIILAHDGGHILAPGAPKLDRSVTVAALPRLLNGLHGMGMTVVDVATLMHHSRRSPVRPVAAARGPRRTGL